MYLQTKCNIFLVVWFTDQVAGEVFKHVPLVSVDGVLISNKNRLIQ